MNSWVVVAIPWAVFAISMLITVLGDKKNRNRKKIVLTCPGSSNPACYCDGTCQPLPVFCSCPTCFIPGGAATAPYRGRSGGIVGNPGWGGGGGGAGWSGSSRGLRPYLRPAHAGLEGFSEQRQADFEFAAGSVRGIRSWAMNAPDFNSSPSGHLEAWRPSLTGSAGVRWESSVMEAVCNSN